MANGRVLTIAIRDGVGVKMWKCLLKRETGRTRCMDDA